jgi:ribosome hibernation promoting factor
MRLSVRGDSVKLSDEFREYIARRLYFALGRFASAIRRVSVKAEDVNGARGGIDKRCYLEVRLRDGRSALLTVTTDDSDLRVAVDRSANRMARSVARELERKRQHRTIQASDGPPRNEEQDPG